MNNNIVTGKKNKSSSSATCSWRIFKGELNFSSHLLFSNFFYSKNKPHRYFGLLLSAYNITYRMYSTHISNFRRVKLVITSLKLNIFACIFFFFRIKLSCSLSLSGFRRFSFRNFNTRVKLIIIKFIPDEINAVLLKIKSLIFVNFKIGNIGC